jgi:Raf kinase inhibitor-like YbhB/YbcL family protein
MPFKLSSSAFPNNGSIPQQYTCDGANSPPPLKWHGVPATAKSLALIVVDPDAPDPQAPKRTYVHWVVYDIPASANGIGDAGSAPAGARDGLNDWNRRGYGGPCPPIGRHHYFFKLFALDTVLDELRDPTKGQTGAGHARSHHRAGRADRHVPARGGQVGPTRPPRSA